MLLKMKIMKKIINTILLILISLSILAAQDTFEGGIGQWNIQNNCLGNYFMVGTAAGNGISLSGIKSMYVANNNNYGVSNCTGDNFIYKKFTNVCLNSTLHFDYRIKGNLLYTNRYHGLVIYSYDSINWTVVDTLTTNNCYHWYNKSIPFIFTQSTVYIGFKYEQDIDDCIHICAPLAVDNILLICDSPLPILLSNFSIKYADCFIDVAFTTDVEMNTKSFTLQYSSNASIWMDIYKFKAKGQCLVPTTYQRNKIPFFPLLTDNYFRIMETDLMGEIYYYDIVVFSLINDCENNTQYYDILGRYYEGGMIKFSKNTKYYEEH